MEQAIVLLLCFISQNDTTLNCPQSPRGSLTNHHSDDSKNVSLSLFFKILMFSDTAAWLFSGC